jgi:hypothetical protein
VFPDGLTALPKASNLNFVAGQTVPNAVLSTLTDGATDFFNGSGGNVDVVVDLFGVFAPAVSQTVIGAAVRPPLGSELRARPGLRVRGMAAERIMPR